MRFAGTQLSNFMGDVNDFSNISNKAQDGRSLERRATMMGEGLLANAGVEGLAQTKSSEFRADAIRAGGQAQGQAAMASGLGSMFSGLAGGISSMGSKSFSYAGGPGTSGTRMGAGGGSVGGYGTLGPNYGIYQG